jgi:hypothetical protein
VNAAPALFNRGKLASVCYLGLQPAVCMEGIRHTLDTQWSTVCRGPHNGALHGAQPSLTQEGHSGHITSLQHSSFEYQ